MNLEPAFSGAADTPAFRGLLHNEDCTDFFFHSEIPPGRAGEVVDRYVDVLAAAGVSALFCNTNARRTNYRSDVWESFWDGYDPDGSDDQPFLASVSDGLQRYRGLVHNMLEVHRQGVDYPERVTSRCRHHGISPWISLRMNDVHYNGNLEHPFHSAFFRELRFHRRGCTGYFARAVDYAHPEARAHFMELVEETLERYDVDGLELDFLREPYLFSVGEERAGRHLLTSWLGEVRRAVDRAAALRGHRLRVGVRVPSRPRAALDLGMDVPGWCRKGIVDLVVPAPRFRTLEFDIPMHEWRSLLGPGVVLAGGLESRYQPYPDSPFSHVSPEHAAGAAASVLAGGGDAVYTFNYFQNSIPFWSREDYRRVLASISSLEGLRETPRHHCVTWRDVVGPDEEYSPPLPARGTEIRFDLPLGPCPEEGAAVELIVETADREGIGSEPLARINGQRALPRPAPPGGRDGVVTYDLAPDALGGRDSDEIALESCDGRPTEVLRVEVRILPRQSRSGPGCPSEGPHSEEAS